MNITNLKLGKMYISGIDRALYDSPSVWSSKVIGQLDKNIPFVLLDSGDFIKTSCLKILTANGTVGFVKIFQSFGETINCVESNEV